MNEMETIRQQRDVPAKRGMRVVVDGKAGKITSAKHGYIMVRFDGQKHSMPCHPTWRVEYLDGKEE